MSDRLDPATKTERARQAGRWRAALFVGAAAVGGWAALVGAQGMGSVRRPARTVPAIHTSLPPISVDFRDVAEEAGLTAPTVSGDEIRKRYLLETTGAGVAIVDVDNDGLMDVFVVNGAVIDGESTATSHLYRNRGGLRFEDVTARAGLTRTGWGQGVCAGDYDNDGDRDLFVTYFGQSVLYANQGNGTFRDATVPAGVLTSGTRWETGCSFVDYDLDGRLDLVVSSYLEFDRAKVPEPGGGGYCQWKGLPVMCGPRGLPFSRNRLLHNEGGGRFSDVSMKSGIGATTGCYGFTVSALDADNDGAPDLYVACDSTPSLLYRNRRDGTFEEVGLLSGVALNEDGQEQGGMGVAIADYDEDGDEDIVKTNFSDDIPNVYHNAGRGLFEDRVLQSGLGGYMQFVGWGVHLLDVDHDGLRDLLMINGHVYPEAEKTGVGYRQPRLLYWHVGGGRFKDISDRAGPAIGAAFSSRGSAAGDLDNDGSLEVVVNNLGARPSLLKNLGPRRHWLLLRLVGSSANRDAVGARAVVHVGTRRVSGEVRTGSSFISQNDSRIHVGLGSEARYDRIEVTWPGGAREVFDGGAADRIVTLEQGASGRKP